MAITKRKISLSLATDLVALIDRRATKQGGATRSAIIDAAVRAWATRSTAKEIDDATAAYYQSLTPAERDEDATWARLGNANVRSEKA